MINWETQKEVCQLNFDPETAVLQVSPFYLIVHGTAAMNAKSKSGYDAIHFFGNCPKPGDCYVFISIQQ